MRRLVLSLAAAGVLACGLTPAAPALAQSPTIRAENRAAEEFNNWMVAMGAWTGGYDRLNRAQMTLLGALNSGILTAQTYFHEQRSAEGRVWAATWAPEQRARLAALRVQLASLSRQPPGLKGPGYDLTANAASMRPLIQAISRLPATTAAGIESNEILCTQIIDVVERAAGGDRSAGLYLVAAYFDLNIAMLETEIGALKVYVEDLERERHPRGASMRAVIALDESLVVAYALLRAADQGKPMDRAAGAAAIRAAAVRIDTAARDMETRTRADARERLPGVLGQKQDAVVKSYLDSVAVLANLAGRLRSAADAVERGAELDYEAVSTSVEAVRSVANQFATMDAERRAILAR